MQHARCHIYGLSLMDWKQGSKLPNNNKELCPRATGFINMCNSYANNFKQVQCYLFMSNRTSGVKLFLW